MIDSWYGSAKFKVLSESSQKGYRHQAEALRAEYGHKLIKAMKREDIEAIMAAKAHAPNAANHDRRILGFLLERAKQQGLVEANVARDTKKLLVLAKGYHVWTEAEIAQFIEAHPKGTIAHTALILMLYTGAGRADVTTFGPGHIRDGRLMYSRPACLDREGVVVDVPLHPALVACIEPLMGHKTFLQTYQGRQRSPNGLGTAMRGWCDEAGLKHCSSNGLRKALARRIGNSGLQEQPIAAALGYASTTTPHAQIGMSNRSQLADLAIAAILHSP
jgi:hypothetical protein